MIGIIFFTCFPFRLVSHAQLSNGASRFLLGKTLGKHVGALDDLLNVLLFVPFGFGLSEKLSEKGKSRGTTLLLVWIAGLLLSYAIEFTQLYIPGRDSGWEDVLTNSTGSVAGFLLSIIVENALPRALSQIERAIESFAKTRRLAVVLLLYFLCWFALSARFQTEAKLTNWEPNARLWVGNDAAGRDFTAWKGEISRLEIWDRPLSRKTAIALTGGTSAEAAAPPAIVTYDFADGPPFHDRMKLLSDLAWSNTNQPRGDPNPFVLDGGWLASAAPASGLVADLQRTNQFAIQVVCKAAQGDGSDGRIVSISAWPNIANLTLRQQYKSLVFWFRSPLSVRHAQLTWLVPNTFAPNQARNILYSYDGSSLSLYIDGKPVTLPYVLGPGAALAHIFRRVRPSELEVYHDIYYALMFFPAGVALGIFLRAGRAQWMGAWLFFAVALIMPPAILEYVLTAVSGRNFSPGNFVLSVAILALGAAWINAEGKPGARVPVA